MTNSLMEYGEDFTRLLRCAARTDCRRSPHAILALSGEDEAEMNLLVLGRDATTREVVQSLSVIQSHSIRSLVLAEGGSLNALEILASMSIPSPGELPLLERRAGASLLRSSPYVRLASDEEWTTLAPLAAAAFVLSVDACQATLPPELAKQADIELWVFEKNGSVLGCGVFIRDGDRVGIYIMSVHPDWQRRGIGRAVLTTAMRSYEDRGVKKFTLGASPKGLPLYRSEGFAMAASPHLFILSPSRAGSLA